MKNLDIKKIKKYSKSKTNVIYNNNNVLKFSFLLLFILGFFVLIYLLFLGNTIFNIVERKTLENSFLGLNTEVSNLELEYLSKINQVDKSLAFNMGFQETKNKYFTTRLTIGVLKLQNNEI